MKVVGSREKNLAIAHLEFPRLVFDAGVRAADDRARRNVAVGGPIKDEYLLRIRNRHQVGGRIDSYTHYMPELRIRPLDEAGWRDVPTRVPRENHNVPRIQT